MHGFNHLLVTLIVFWYNFFDTFSLFLEGVHSVKIDLFLLGNAGKFYAFLNDVDGLLVLGSEMPSI